jgi:hypothetical protein
LDEVLFCHCYGCPARAGNKTQDKSLKCAVI